VCRAELRFSLHPSLSDGDAAWLRSLLASSDARVAEPASGHWASFIGASEADGERVVVAASPVGALPPGPALYRPLAGRFVELREPSKGGLAPLAAYLRRLHVEVGVSRGTTMLGSNLLLGRFLAPLALAIAGGERAELVDATVRELGFVRGAAGLLASPRSLEPIVRPFVSTELGSETLAKLARPSAVSELAFSLPPASTSPAVRSAVTISLLAAVEATSFLRPPIVDLAARELLGFREDLCSYLTPRRVREALTTLGDGARLVDEAALSAADRFAYGRSA